MLTLFKEMNKCDKIIPLGMNCNISFLLQSVKLKKETSLFEWFQSIDLQSITDIIKIILENENNIDILMNLVQKYGDEPRHVFIHSKSIHSCHYYYDEYLLIYKRRVLRFIDNLNNNIILFIRLCDYKNNPSIDQINDFFSLYVSKKHKLLLISIINRSDIPTYIVHNNVIHKFFYYEDIKNIIFMKEETIINKLLLEYINEAGYNISNMSDEEFTDKTI